MFTSNIRRAFASVLHPYDPSTLDLQQSQIQKTHAGHQSSTSQEEDFEIPSGNESQDADSEPNVIPALLVDSNIENISTILPEEIPQPDSTNTALLTEDFNPIYNATPSNTFFKVSVQSHIQDSELNTSKTNVSPTGEDSAEQRGFWDTETPESILKPHFMNSEGPFSSSETEECTQSRKTLLDPLQRRLSYTDSPGMKDGTNERKILLNPLQRRLSTSGTNSFTKPFSSDSHGLRTTSLADEPPSQTRRSKDSFHPFLQNLAIISVTENESPTETTTTREPYSGRFQKDVPIPPNNSSSSQPSTKLSTTTIIPSSQSTTETSRSTSSSEADDKERQRRHKRPQNTFSMLQSIVESGDNVSPPPKPTASSFSPNMLALDSAFSKRMEDIGRLRRLQSQSSLNSKSTSSSSSVSHIENPPVPQKQTYSKAQSEDKQLLVSPEKTSPLLPPPNIQPTFTNSYPGEQAILEDRLERATLQDLLDCALRDLKAAQEENVRILNKDTTQKSRLTQQLRITNEELLALRKENQSQSGKILTLGTNLKKVEQELHKIRKEKEGWQEQLDTMHHRLKDSERQVRCLDHLTRFKLEARQEGVYGPTKRTKMVTFSTVPSLEVIAAVQALNDEILQIANLLVENVERTRVYHAAADVTLAKEVLGEKVTTMMQAQLKDQTKGFRFLLVQVVLEIFMVHWCTNIIEAWYPRQQSFADVLIEYTNTTANSSSYSGQKVNCGKVKILQTASTTTTVTVKFPEWVTEIVRDLSRILVVAGLRISPVRQSLFNSKLLILVRMAYDVRTALAEKDICGNLDLSVVRPDMPFQPKWMDEAHVLLRKPASTTTTMDPIAGTCGMGLQISGVSKSSPNLVLRPKVVLARVLEESS